MPYAKLDVEFVRRHFAALEPKERIAAIALYTRLVLASAELLLDGVLPVSVVEAGAHEIGLSRGRYRRREMHDLCISLASCGLVEMLPDGTWHLPMWKDHHASREYVDNRRKLDAERKAQAREQTTLSLNGRMSAADARADSAADILRTHARDARTRAEAEELPLTSKRGPRAEEQRPAAADQDDEWPNREDPVFRLLATCRQVDANTERTLRSFVGRVPEAAFDYVRDELERKRGEVEHDARYAVQVLKRIQVEGELATPAEPEEAPSSNGARPNTVEARAEYVRKTGYLLPDDELEYQLAQMAADPDEITGHLETAYDLRAGSVT